MLLRDTILNMEIEFNGQQTDERILATIRPQKMHTTMKILALAGFAIFLIILSIVIAVTFPHLAIMVVGLACVISGIFISVGYWWNTTVDKKTITYITDRRVIRFEAYSPFHQTKRGLFWNEVLKAKAYANSFWGRMLHIGTVQVEAHLSPNENIYIHNVSFYEDIANYIDKILYIFKNKPSDMETLKPFIFKPRGERG